MNVEEFLESGLVGRRSKISAFDNEIRLLRARGVSGQGIANFLKLNNVQVTKNAVNGYFKRYPDRHPAAKPVSSGQVPPVAAGARPAIVKADQFEHADDQAQGQPAEVPEPTATSIGREASPSSQIPELALHPKTSGSLEHARRAGTERGAPTAHHNPIEGALHGLSRSAGQPADAFGPDQIKNDVTGPANQPAETSNAGEKSCAFSPRAGGNDNYDGEAGSGKTFEVTAHSGDQPQRSPLIRYDPSDPKNVAAKASYQRRLRAGEIRTGEITNSQRYPDARQEPPDPS
ncbi:hypothetical protein [Paraburkholderia sp. GAS32]|uniref:hypothetical protein n=1 Tax=Paraburkholderia sp. GAS32 TaxID=3035129 RepID=UPI003D1C9068